MGPAKSGASRLDLPIKQIVSGFKQKAAMKRKTAGLIIGLFAIGCTATEVSFLSAPPVPINHQACSSNSECILIQRDCDDCDCGTPVNKKYEAVYANEKQKMCANYKGPVCDLSCRTNSSICLNGKCVPG